MSFQHLPSPPELMRQFERGELSREELHAMMALHARALIVEMEEDHANPLQAMMEQWRNRRMAQRWVRRHGERVVRELLAVVGRQADFPPGRLLWNVSHGDVPLHCFFRCTRAPIFRLRGLEVAAQRAVLEIEHGPEPVQGVRVTLQRDLQWQWQWLSCQSSAR